MDDRILVGRVCLGEVSARIPDFDRSDKLGDAEEEGGSDRCSKGNGLLLRSQSR
jgi:hypothetical protein